VSGKGQRLVIFLQAAIPDSVPSLLLFQFIFLVYITLSVCTLYNWLILTKVPIRCPLDLSSFFVLHFSQTHSSRRLVFAYIVFTFQPKHAFCMHYFTKMYQAERSSTYAPYSSNVWSHLMDAILCIQGHMFWIYSAVFCLWEESSLSLEDMKKISPASNTPSKPASESKRRLDTTKTVSNKKISRSRIKPVKDAVVSYQHKNMSSPCLTTTVVEKTITKPDIQLESPSASQRKRKELWQSTITQIMKRRDPNNQIHPLEKLSASSSAPSLPAYTEEDLVIEHKAPRRSSAPAVSHVYDSRPSIHEERHGITKPPRWWRKMTTVRWKRRNTA
jgi:hypothetical protein